MNCKIESLIEALEAGRDLQQVLGELHLTHAQAMAMLQTKQGRRLRSLRRRLSRTGMTLLAQRFGPHAVQRLCHLLSEAKGEVQLKAIIALLGVVAGDGKARKNRRGGAPAGGDVVETSAEERELLAYLAREVNGRKAGGPAEKAGAGSFSFE